MSGIFVARYSSRCLACEGGIREGDEVRWAEDSVVHADCKPRDVLTLARPACPRCFMEPAANGLCGCDE